MEYNKRPCNADDCDNYITRPELCQKCMDTAFNIELSCSMVRKNLLQYLIDNKYKLPIKWREMSINAIKDDMKNFLSNEKTVDILNDYNSKRMINIILRLANITDERIYSIEFNNGSKVTCIPANEPSISKIKTSNYKDIMKKEIGGFMCDCCNGKEFLIYNEGAFVSLKNNKIILINEIYSSGTLKTEIQINYCPVCGRKLKDNMEVEIDI